MTPTYTLPVVSYDTDSAAAATGLSARTIKLAMADGSLTVHYAGARRGKPIIRAVDLDAWVQSLPTERGAA